MRAFSTRAQFLFELTLAEHGKVPSEFDLIRFRKGLQILSQDTRFQIFRLISEFPGHLSLEDICERLGGVRSKYYNHVYQMMRVELIVAQASPDGRRTFVPNKTFLGFGRMFFSAKEKV